MEQFGSLCERLRSERERLGLTQEAVADAVRLHGAKGVTRQSISAYEAGRRTPDAHYLMAVASLGVDVQYVVTGKRSATSDADVVLQRSDGSVVVLEVKAEEPLTPYLSPKPDWEVVPRLGVKVSAGNGDRAEAVVDEATGMLAFSREWMREHFGRAGQGFASVSVVGDSMEPTLCDGDEIVVDLRATDYAHREGLYVIAHEGDLRCKRLRRRMDGTIEVWGDNPAYRPELLQPGTAVDLKVLGRVVWPRIR